MINFSSNNTIYLKHIMILLPLYVLYAPGCGSLGYYLIYDGGDNLLPRVLLARIYRAKFPELSYSSPLLAFHAQSGVSTDSTVSPHGNEVSNLKKASDLVEYNELKLPALGYRLPKVRVAFVSAFWCHHSVGVLLQVKYLNSQLSPTTRT